MITIDKAIERLRDTESTYHHRRWREYIGAAGLGIEALKRIQSQRSLSDDVIQTALPGEKKE